MQEAFMDYYNFFQLPWTATEEAICEKYRERIEKCLFSKIPEEKKRQELDEINRVFDLLTDEIERRKYNLRYLSNQLSYFPENYSLNLNSDPYADSALYLTKSDLYARVSERNTLGYTRRYIRKNDCKQE